MVTGKIKWLNQVTPKDSFLVGCGRAGGAGNCPEKNGPDYDFGSSPVLRTLPNGKQILLGGQKSGVMWAFDPDDNGKVLWQMKVGNGGAGRHRVGLRGRRGERIHPSRRPWRGGA